MTLEGVLCYSPSWEKRKKGLIKTPELNFQSTFYTVKNALGEKRALGGKKALESIFGAYFGNVLKSINTKETILVKSPIYHH